jgi:hypothetical protein
VRCWILSWAVTLEISARRRSEKSVNENRKRRVLSNDDDVFRSVCSAYLRPICADMTHSPRENPPPRCCFGFQYAFGRVQAQHLDMNRVVSMWKVVLTPFVRRCDNNAQLFHNLKRIPFNVAGGIEPDCHECVGWCVHVFHLRVLIRIRMCELRRKKATPS